MWHEIAFDSAGSWNCDNDIVRNFIFFCIDNSLLSHAGNRKNNFFLLGDGPTFGINGRFSSSQKKISINFSKASTKFCMSLNYNADNSL